MADKVGSAEQQENYYGERFKTKRDVYVIKKDGAREDFNVQKVINAVGKSAYRALTKFTEEEKAMTQGDKNMEITLPFICTDIQYQTD